MANTRPSKTDMLAKRISTEGVEIIPAIIAALAPLERGGQQGLASASLDAWKMAVSRLRKAVATSQGLDLKAEPPHPTVKMLALPTDAYEESNRVARQAGFEKRRDLRGVRAKTLLRIARQIVRDDDAGAYELLSALCLLTGRRIYEVASAGTVVTITPASQHLMRFSGQLKKRDESQHLPYEIAVLADPRVIAKAWKRCQRAFKGMDAKSIAQIARAWSQDTFQDAEGVGLQTRELRAVYAAIITKAKPNNEAVNTYLARMLGHSKGDDITALAYLQFYDADDPEARIQTQRRAAAIKKHGRTVVTEIESQRAARAAEERNTTHDEPAADLTTALSESVKRIREDELAPRRKAKAQKHPRPRR